MQGLMVDGQGALANITSKVAEVENGIDDLDGRLSTAEDELHDINAHIEDLDPCVDGVY